jgi:regulator of protease activity HflC (stomatin/prohibitin superfamily)
VATISRNYFSRKKYAFLRWLDGKMLTILLIILLFVSALIVLWPRVLVIIPTGSNGVIYRPLGGGVDLNDLLREGAKLILPWNKVTEYSVQIQLKELKLQLMTADLLKTNVTVSFQYEVNPYTLPYLHKYVGVNYLDKMIIPQVIKVTREKIAKLSSQVAFTGDIGQVANDIAITTDSLLVDQLSPPGLSNVRLIRISSVQLTSVEYPPDVQAAIVNKLVEAENADAYKFKIQAARAEAERKVIEANGIKGFQDIVNEGMTERYLRYRGIQATEDLAKSGNAKTLIFGSGPSGLPLILGNAVDQPNSVSATQSAPSTPTAPQPVQPDTPKKPGETN